MEFTHRWWELWWAFTCQHTSAGVKWAYCVWFTMKRRISLSEKVPRGVQCVSLIIINWIWVSQVERAMHGRTLNTCSVLSLIEPAWVLTQSRSHFTAPPAWIWFIVISVVIQSDSDVHSVYRLFSFDTLSDSGLSPPRLSMNVLVQSTSVTACEWCNMSSYACCACRCQGGYLCCRIGHRSPPLFHCLSLFPLFFLSFPLL